MGILLTVSYDGTNYAGWQIQQNDLAVQEVLEGALLGLYKRPVKTMGASRTDAGVHALGQRVHFLNVGLSSIPLDKLPLAINNFLPPDIVVTKAIAVPDSFHPIFDAKAKTYRYTVYNRPFMNPLLRNSAYFVRFPLDCGKMALAADHFVGAHDFAAFCASGSSAKTTVRTVYSLDVAENDGLITFTIRGGGFLYNMVRIIAGTLLSVGEGKLLPEDIPDIITSRRREKAGRTAPPQGLTLLSVEYDL